MKKKSLKTKILEMGKKELQKVKGGTRSMYDLEEVTVTGKKQSPLN